MVQRGGNPGVFHHRFCIWRCTLHDLSETRGFREYLERLTAKAQTSCEATEERSESEYSELERRKEDTDKRKQRNIALS